MTAHTSAGAGRLCRSREQSVEVLLSNRSPHYLFREVP